MLTVISCHSSVCPAALTHISWLPGATITDFYSLNSSSNKCLERFSSDLSQLAACCFLTHTHSASAWKQPGLGGRWAKAGALHMCVCVCMCVYKAFSYSFPSFRLPSWIWELWLCSSVCLLSPSLPATVKLVTTSELIFFCVCVCAAGNRTVGHK